MMRLLLGVTLVAAMAGCKNTTAISRIDGFVQPTHLSRQGAVYVALPQNGSFEGAEYRASGRHTAEAIATAFALFADRVDRAEAVEAIPVIKQRARASNCAYCVEATILHWEDRNTEWSGKPDVISIRIAIFNAITGQAIDEVLLNGKSKWATFGGDHPQDLLAEPITRYVAELYGEKPPPRPEPSVTD